MKKITALILVVALSACASTAAYRTSQVAVVGTQIADVHSTQLAISRGAVERNPIVGPGLFRQVLIKSGATVLILAAAHHIRQQEHRTLATVLLTAISVGYGVIAYRNYRLAERLDR